jgi:hypothetical protein
MSEIRERQHLAGWGQYIKIDLGLQNPITKKINTSTRLPAKLSLMPINENKILNETLSPKITKKLSIASNLSSLTCDRLVDADVDETKPLNSNDKNELIDNKIEDQHPLNICLGVIMYIINIFYKIIKICKY